jgi:two-component system chemotaxis response regulator CheV
LGIQFVQTTTGKEAWDYLQQLARRSAEEGLAHVQRINMVLSDIEMPDMDGFTLTKQIRSDPRLAHIPVVLHSSLTGTCNQDKGRQVGATDYVTKFDPKLLGEIVMRHIN